MFVLSANSYRGVAKVRGGDCYRQECIWVLYTLVAITKYTVYLVMGSSVPGVHPVFLHVPGISYRLNTRITWFETGIFISNDVLVNRLFNRLKTVCYIC